MNRHHRLVLLHHKILSGWQKTRRKTKNECKRGPGWKDDGDGIIHIASFYFFSLKLRKEERGGWKKETKAKKTCSIAAINYAGMMWLSWHVQQRIIKARWSDKGLSPIFFHMQPISSLTAWHINGNDESLARLSSSTVYRRIETTHHKDYVLHKY